MSHEELALRCPFCGDSTRSATKTHFSVNMRTGLYHCYRCGVGGRFSLAELTGLLASRGITPAALSVTLAETGDGARWRHALALLQPGPASARPSALDRYHVTDVDGSMADAFLSRGGDGAVRGVQVINMARHARRMYGTRLLGWRGDVLQSSAHDPLRLVEGPWDCLSHRDLCSFGTPSRHTFRELRYQYVLLCPDGDVWGTPHLRRAWQTVVRQALCTTGVLVVGVEKLPPDKDPDEVPYSERERVSVQEFLRTC